MAVLLCPRLFIATIIVGVAWIIVILLGKKDDTKRADFDDANETDPGLSFFEEEGILYEFGGESLVSRALRGGGVGDNGLFTG